MKFHPSSSKKFTYPEKILAFLFFFVLETMSLSDLFTYTVGDAILFTLALFLCFALLCISVHNLVILSDLECDYINAASCCEKLNYLIPIELSLHFLLTIIMLYNYHFMLLIFQGIPFLYLLNQFLKVPPGASGYYDPTQIHIRSYIKLFIRHAMIKLGFFIVFFFVYLYSLIYSLIA